MENFDIDFSKYGIDLTGKDLNISEIDKLESLLKGDKIPYLRKEYLGGYQICYPDEDNVVCDAILNPFSYGHKEGLLEIMGLVDEEKIGDKVEGYLTAEDVFKRMKKHFIESKKKGKFNMVKLRVIYLADDSYPQFVVIKGDTAAKALLQLAERCDVELTEEDRDAAESGDVLTLIDILADAIDLCYVQEMKKGEVYFDNCFLDD